LGTADVGLELRRNWWAAAEFGKGAGDANLPAAAQESAVPLKDAEGGFVSLGLGCVYESPQHGIGLIREEFGVGFQDATGFLQSFGLDEGEDGFHKLRAPPQFSKCFLYPHLPAAAQESAVPLKDAEGGFVSLGLGCVYESPKHGIGFVREEFGVGL
jgi:hypothetical protein